MTVKYKIFGMDDGETLYIGKMKLENYLWYLTRNRHFNFDAVIKHTLKYYNVDLTEVLKDVKYIWESRKNLVEDFNVKFPKRKEDDGTREYFNTYGRLYYERFMDYAYFGVEDCLIHYYDYRDIHHIHPLVYGGKSDIENLIHVCNFTHDLLHENPREDDEQFCNYAVDYLGQLMSEENVYNMIDKYKLTQYSDSMFLDMFKACIKEEMRSFYESIKHT